MVHLVCRSGCSSNAAFFGVPLGPLYSGRQRVPARRMRSRTRGLRRRRRKDERFVLPPAMVIRAEPRGGIARGDPAARPPRNASVAASGICYRVLVSPVAPRRASAIVSMPTCGKTPNEPRCGGGRAEHQPWRPPPRQAATASKGGGSSGSSCILGTCPVRGGRSQLVRTSARFRAPRRLPPRGLQGKTQGKYRTFRLSGSSDLPA